MNCKVSFIATLWPCVVLLLGPTATYASGDFLYAEMRTASSDSTFIGPIPVAGLSINLPAASTKFNTALVTLNMPN